MAEEYKSDTVTLPANRCNPWRIIKRFHPYKQEILTVVRLLDSLGASLNVIAAALRMQGWKVYHGGGTWTEEDVKYILEW